MNFGVFVFPTEYSLHPGEVARLAEERGFESLWVPEHTHIPVSRRSAWPGGPVLPKHYLHTLDPFVALTAAASTTRQIKLGTGICLIVERDPITTAKEVASLDVISGGRVLFGIGGGWNVEEMEDHGTDGASRFSLLRERVLAMKALWQAEEAEYHGRFVDFDRAWSYPKPLQEPHPPVLMGGDSPKTFDRVLEFCDGWLPLMRGVGSVTQVAEKTRALRRRAQEAGRDLASISVGLLGCPPQQDAVDELMRAGLDRIVFNLPSEGADTAVPLLDEYARLMR